MKRSDKATVLFWLVFSIFICIESACRGIGRLGHPGMGFVAFGTLIFNIIRVPFVHPVSQGEFEES